MNFFEMIGKADYAVLIFVRDHLSSPFADKLFVYISIAGDRALLWMITAVVLLFFKKTRPAGFLTLAVLLFELIVSEVFVKTAVQRQRPFVEYGFKILVQPPPSFSFPSGHALSSFSSAVVFFHFIGRKARPFIAVAVLISFSRIYLLVHYPSDVLAGALLGILTAFFAVRIYERSVVATGKNSQAD